MVVHLDHEVRCCLMLVVFGPGSGGKATIFGGSSSSGEESYVLLFACV